jgi:hypothetical protein
MYGDILRSVPYKDIGFVILPFILLMFYLWNTYYRTFTLTKPEKDCERALQCYVNDLPSSFYWNCVVGIIILYTFARRQKLAMTFDSKTKGMITVLVILTLLYYVLFSQVRQLYEQTLHMSNEDEQNFLANAETHINILDTLNSTLPFVAGALIGYWGTKI